MFNNREIAIAIWFMIITGFVVFKKPDIFRSVRLMVRTFCKLKILIPYCIMLFYVTLSVFILYKIGIWKADLLKDTIVWFWVSAMAMSMRYVTSDESKNIFKSIMIDNLKIIIILEFIVNSYTFLLYIELIIVPVITCFVLLEAVAGLDRKNIIVEKFAKGVLGGFGLILFVVAIKHVFDDFHSISKIDALRSILLVPFLSLMLSPFIYALVLFAKYELVFLRLDFGKDKSKDLKRYARCRILRSAGINLGRLDRLLENHASDLIHLQTQPDVDMLMQKIS